jgi:hypothetical protein
MGCMRSYPGDRFDPARCMASCPVCGSYGSANPGEPCAPHQAPGSREMCSGSGQAAV